MQIFRNLEHNVKRNLTSRLSILSLSPLVGVPSKPCKNQIAVKNLRIVAQWWTSAEGHLLRMYFGVFQPSVAFLCILTFKVLSNREDSQVRVLPLNWEEVGYFSLKVNWFFSFWSQVSPSSIPLVPDIVIGADLVYHADLLPHLVTDIPAVFF